MNARLLILSLAMISCGGASTGAHTPRAPDALEEAAAKDEERRAEPLTDLRGTAFFITGNLPAVPSEALRDALTDVGAVLRDGDKGDMTGAVEMAAHWETRSNVEVGGDTPITLRLIYVVRVEVKVGSAVVDVVEATRDTPLEKGDMGPVASEKAPRLVVQNRVLQRAIAGDLVRAVRRSAPLRATLRRTKT